MPLFDRVLRAFAHLLALSCATWIVYVGMVTGMWVFAVGCLMMLVAIYARHLVVMARLDRRGGRQ